jgi:replicative DNA helicase
MQENRPAVGMGKLIVGKNRNGATRDIDVVFDNSYTRFRDYYLPQGG